MSRFFTSLIIGLALIMFSACGDDDSDTLSLADTLPGTWTISAINIEASTTTPVLGQPVEVASATTTLANSSDAQLTFTSNPNNYSSTGNLTVIITGEIGGVGLQPVTESFPAFGGGTWSASGDMMTFNENLGESLTLTAQEISSSLIVLVSQETETEMVGGVEETTTTNSEIRFTR
ncbi:MAG: hypothetical protein AAGF87_17965 [Bacteroidota bacterium]